MAAGLSLPVDRVDAFADAFAAAVAGRIGPDGFAPELLSDGELAADEFCRPLADALRNAGPWGQGCPEPVFDGTFAVEEWRCVGSKHLRMRVRPEGARAALPAIAFNAWTGAPAPATIRLAFQLEPDDWHGGGGVQLLVRHTA